MLAAVMRDQTEMMQAYRLAAIPRENLPVGVLCGAQAAGAEQFQRQRQGALIPGAPRGSRLVRARFISANRPHRPHPRYCPECGP